MLYRYLSLALFLITAVGLRAQTLLGFDGEQHSHVGVFIKDLNTGQVLVDHNSLKVLTPASITKSITTATALSIVGGDYRFETVAKAVGAIDGTTLRGDLVIEASGDPTLESDQFKENRGFCDSIIRHLNRLGIKKIEGTVRVRETYPDQGPNVNWEIEDLGYTYGTGWYALNWRDNVFRYVPATGVSTPHVPQIEVVKHRTTSGGTDVIRGINSDIINVYSPSLGKKDFSFSTTMPDPALVMIHELKGKLRGAGIDVGDAMKESGAEPTVVYTHYSPAAAEIMRSLMIRSDNMFAEGMLRVIAPGQGRTKALEREKKLWSDRGLETKYTSLFDGSGLARSDRFSPRFIAAVLQYMAKSDMAAQYTGFFPKAGLEGTLKSLLAKTRLEGKVALKTGSMNGVQCYAGYKLDNAGKPTHVVVIMINGFYCPRADLRKSVENLLLKTFK